MIEDNVPVAKGWLKIFSTDRLGNRELIVDQNNALVPNSRTIIAYLLGQQSSYALDSIKVYKAAALLATSPSVVISFPTDSQVQFNARFDEGSFNDTLDEVKLESAIGGIFSEVSGLSVLKDDTLQLEIQWLLTINNL